MKTETATQQAKGFSERLRDGLKFEQQASQFMTAQGFPIGLNLSRAAQWKSGESAAHCEIKLDTRWKATGNLFIETMERRDIEGESAWRLAGIHDKSAPWFYLIGDYEKLWLLPVAALIRLDFSGGQKAVETDTAQGFLLRAAHADMIAIRTFEDWSSQQQLGEPT